MGIVNGYHIPVEGWHKPSHDQLARRLVEIDLYIGAVTVLEGRIGLEEAVFGLRRMNMESV